MKNKSQKFVGTVYSLSGVMQKGSSSFCDLVISETVNDRLNLAKFEVMNKALDQLHGIKEKDLVEVEYNINGREYQGKVYNNLHVTKITMVREFVPNLFDANNVELPEANEFDELENEFENE